MSDFKDVAHRTVVELFDLAKEQQAEIKQLKSQLNNMEACYIEKKKEVEGLKEEMRSAMVQLYTWGAAYEILEKALRGEHENSN